MNMIKEMIIEADMRTKKLREDGRDVDELRVLIFRRRLPFRILIL